MTREKHNDLWRDFPKTAPEFEARFATEEDCRDYWIEARWGGKPACARCASMRVWTIRGGTTFECAERGHQTFDPTPRSCAWVEHQDLCERFVFHPIGISDHDGVARLSFLFQCFL